MVDKKRTILVSYVFDEFQAVVDEMKQQFERRSLKNYGFTINYLNDGQARTENPLDESLKAVQSAYYCVGLIGDSLGGRPQNSEKTYIQHEIEQAINSKDTSLLMWAIGKKYWDGFESPEVNLDVSMFLMKLSEQCTVGTIEHDNASDIASGILNSLEIDVSKNFCDEDNQPPKDGLLEVSGFNQYSVDIKSYGIGEQLKIIYGSDPIHYRSSTLKEYQQLAFEEMRLRNINGALKSLKRLTDYFDSDVVGNFWTARIIAYHKTELREAHVKQAEESIIKVIAALDGANSNAPLIKALCNAILAKIYQLREQYQISNSYIDKARSDYHVYDALQIQVENILININNFNSSKNYGIDKCAKILSGIYSRRASYYFYLEAILRKKFGNNFKIVEASLIRIIYPTIHEMYKNNIILSEILRTNFSTQDLSRKKILEWSIWDIKEEATKITNMQYKNIIFMVSGLGDESNIITENITRYNLREKELNTLNILIEIGKKEVDIVNNINKLNITKDRLKYITFFTKALSMSSVVLLIYSLTDLIYLKSYLIEISGTIFASSFLVFILLHFIINFLENLRDKNKMSINENMLLISTDDIRAYAADRKPADNWCIEIANKKIEMSISNNKLSDNIKNLVKRYTNNIAKCIKEINIFETSTLSCHNNQYSRDIAKNYSLKIETRNYDKNEYLPKNKAFYDIINKWTNEYEISVLNDSLNSCKKPNKQLPCKDISKIEMILTHANPINTAK